MPVLQQRQSRMAQNESDMSDVKEALHHVKLDRVEKRMSLIEV